MAVPIMLLAFLLASPLTAPAQTRIRVGTCARTLTAGVGSQFAVAQKLGWFAQEGLDVEVVPLTGSTDCVKFVATREFLITLPSMEPLAIARQQGVRIKNFYTAYQTPGYAIAVPAESPIQKLSDLKGKTIGVTNMASAGVIIARALAATSGLNPDTDINLVVAGEGAQPAALLRSKQIDALSQFDTQYVLIENAGVKLRILDKRPIERFPSNGFIALEETIQTRARELIGFARAYAKGTVFTMANPEAAVRVLYDVFPFTGATGKDETTAVREDVHVLGARIPQLKPRAGGRPALGRDQRGTPARVHGLLAEVGRAQAARGGGRPHDQRADRGDQSLRCRCDRENGAGVPAALALVGSAVTDSRTPASRRRR